MALSYVSGGLTPSLWERTLPQVIKQQASQFGDHDAAVFPWQNVRLSFNDMSNRSELIAKAMLALGLRQGDAIGIIAGNRFEYIETFLAAGRINCPFVVLNNTYSPKELVSALKVASCKLLFIAPKIGVKDQSEHIKALSASASDLPELDRVVLLSNDAPKGSSRPEFLSYSSFAQKAETSSAAALQSAENGIKVHDILNFQFTSGTTGAPKAAMLTHRNLINNGYLVGAAQKLSPDDIVCCPPPLFHCFGLVMGFLATLTNGCSIVFPSDAFDPLAVIDAVYNEKCTALYGVPTMYANSWAKGLIATLDANRQRKYKISSVRTGLAAGASVPSSVMKRLEQQLGCKGMLIAYGMTETSPVTFITALDDPAAKREKTVGSIMPHTKAKVVGPDGKILPRGVPGELCTSGYSLQTGYFKNPAKTAEAMKTDENGILWMYTGDQCLIDNEGYCVVTGRIKDVIIRGGENIYPAEIEERLIEHSGIAEASVVAIKDERYGEVVGAFLRSNSSESKPGLDEIKDWVKQTMGSHKAPRYVFWIGDPGVGEDYPKTGSGKHQKHILRAIGDRILADSQPKAKL